LSRIIGGHLAFHNHALLNRVTVAFEI